MDCLSTTVTMSGGKAVHTYFNNRRIKEKENKMIISETLKTIKTMKTTAMAYIHKVEQIALALAKISLIDMTSSEKREMAVSLIVDYLRQTTRLRYVPEWLLRGIMGIIVDKIVTEMNNRWGHDWFDSVITGEEEKKKKKKAVESGEDDERDN